MFINKTPDGRNNLCGVQIAALRKAAGLSQRALADQLQLIGLDVDKNAVQRIESGQRFLTDIELLSFSRALQVPLQQLFPAGLILNQ